MTVTLDFAESWSEPRAGQETASKRRQLRELGRPRSSASARSLSAAAPSPLQNASGLICISERYTQPA